MRGRWAVMGAVAAAAIATAGCGGDDDDAGSGGAPITGEQVAATQTALASDPEFGIATRVVVIEEMDDGEILTDWEGHPLYVYAQDEAYSGKSACGEGCEQFWPPHTVATGALLRPGDGVTGDVGAIIRQDGRRQVTYDGKPLYRWSLEGQEGVEPNPDWTHATP
jgi:predicted lipoprotein with Yx(FWY)xxD motif